MRIVLRLVLGALLGLIVQPLYAESGLRYVGDLNGDGVADRLESGPLSNFGNAGGPFVLTLSSPEGAQRFEVDGFGTFAAEVVDEKTFRLWSYGRSSAREGLLKTFTISGGKITEAHLVINPGDGGTELGNALFATIFAGKSRIVTERVDNYTPPPRSSGDEWGK